MYTGFSKIFNYDLDAYNDIYDCKHYTLHYALFAQTVVVYQLNIIE